MINTKRPNTSDYTQVGFIEAKDDQGNYQNIDHIYDSEGNIVFQQGYLNEYDGADDFRISAIGKPLIDYTIYGNTFQDGIPISGNPIMPQGTGERTGNLLDFNQLKNAPSDTIYNITFTHVLTLQLKPNTYYTMSSNGTGSIKSTPADLYRSVYFNSASGESSVNKNNPVTVLTGNIGIVKIGFFSERTNAQQYLNGEAQLWINEGSEPIPYEPFGVKIPISSANTTTPVYLGEVETTRKIKKLVLIGNERFINEGLSAGFYRYRVYLTQLCDAGVDDILSSHYPTTKVTNPNSEAIAKPLTVSQFVRFYSSISSIDDFKAYLASQYAAGTPVTVWYVLAAETTGIVNEPLMRIGDYADSVNFSQAGVEIPTLKRPNTTVINITTSLPPSEVYAKYRGSKTQ